MRLDGAISHSQASIAPSSTLNLYRAFPSLPLAASNRHIYAARTEHAPTRTPICKRAYVVHKSDGDAASHKHTHAHNRTNPPISHIGSTGSSSTLHTHNRTFAATAVEGFVNIILKYTIWRKYPNDFDKIHIYSKHPPHN